MGAKNTPATIAKALGDDDVPEVIPQLTTKKPGMKVPSAAPEIKKKPQTLKVKIDTQITKAATAKKPRGRPKGSKNKPTNLSLASEIANAVVM